MGLRTVRNFTEGLGITWNLGERTQLFTCPLWMMLFTPFYFLTREGFFTTVYLQFFIGLLFYFRLYRCLGKISFLTLSFFLLCSSSFTDYQSSGTESALSLLLWCFFLTTPSFKKEKFLFAALLILNRLDFLIILSPWLALSLYKERNYKEVSLLLLPAALWSLFSLFYFGLPLPTTFYAKITNSISFLGKIELGLSYYKASIKYDPLLGLSLLILPFLLIKMKKSPLLYGSVIYVIYLLVVGGDFMAGRLITSLYLIILYHAVQAFSFSPISKKCSLPIAFAFLVVSFLGVKSPFLPVTHKKEFFYENGVADEKQFYAAQGNSPLIRLIFKERPYYSLEAPGNRNDDRRNFYVSYVVGMFGFYTHPNQYILEPSGIASPFMIYFPTIKNARQGHYLKRVPKELVAYYKNGTPLPEGQLRNYMEKWHLILSSPLFSVERLRAIWDINTINYKQELSNYWDNPESFKKGKGVGVERLIL